MPVRPPPSLSGLTITGRFCYQFSGDMIQRSLGEKPGIPHVGKRCHSRNLERPKSGEMALKNPMLIAEGHCRLSTTANVPGIKRADCPARYPPSDPTLFFAGAPDRPSSDSQPLTLLASSESAGTKMRNRFHASDAPFASPFSFRACPLSKRACA